MGKDIASSCQRTAGARGSMGTRMLEAVGDAPRGSRSGPCQPVLVLQLQTGSRADPHGQEVCPGHSLTLWAPGNPTAQQLAGWGCISAELPSSPGTQAPSRRDLKTLTIINTRFYTDKLPHATLYS